MNLTVVVAIAAPPTHRPSDAFLAISLMLTPISSAPAATVWRFWLTWCAAFETTSACAEVSSELAVICWLVAENSSLAVATCCALAPMDTMMLRNLLCILLMAVVKSPSSSLLTGLTSSWVKSPAAMASACARTDPVAAEICRLR